MNKQFQHSTDILQTSRGEGKQQTLQF